MDSLRASLEKTQISADYRSAVLYLHLYGFKPINDTLGHRIGDLLLMEIALHLKACARPQDTLARMSGDELTLLFNNLKTRDKAQSVAERVLAVVHAPMVVVGGTVLQLTASVGLCEVLKSHGEAEYLFFVMQIWRCTRLNARAADVTFFITSPCTKKPRTSWK